MKKKKDGPGVGGSEFSAPPKSANAQEGGPSFRGEASVRKEEV